MIVIRYDREGCAVHLEGHACSGAPGRDLVCAAASVLAYTLAADVEGLARAGDARQVRIVLRPGLADIRCQPRSPERVRTVFDAVFTGFRLLAKQYPQNIEVRG